MVLELSRKHMSMNRVYTPADVIWALAEHMIRFKTKT